MSEISPVIVVGTGPAGTSAALALVERGIPVVMLEAGTDGIKLPPKGSYLDLRFGDPTQWHWMFGRNGEAMRGSGATSPKLRVPGFQPIFANYAASNHIHPSPQFGLVGALAPGGLSNAWGCGVAAFDRDELGALGSERDAMMASYARVGTRMGISGASDDALQEILGVDAFSDLPLPLDALHEHLWARRARLTSCGHANFALGRARVAALSQPRKDRSACDLSGMCLWGCSNRATWSASYDVATLLRHRLAKIEFGVSVQSLTRAPDETWLLDTKTAEGARQFRACKVLLAAGTIASTRLVLAALSDPPQRVRLKSNPMAAFLLWIPSALGQARTRGFGLAQLSFSLGTGTNEPAFGNVFSTAGIPVSEFIAHLPVSRRAGLPLLRSLLSSTLVGNVFLPGSMSQHEITLEHDRSLKLVGGENARLRDCFRSVRNDISRNFRGLGAWMLPGSFVVGATGADVHYACTLPASTQPAPHECNVDGEVAALRGVYAIDGAGLSELPAKAHTLTIMANADRIARRLSME